MKLTILQNSIFLFSLGIFQASAGIYTDNTRAIISGNNGKRETSVQINSSASSESPYLVKSQITRDINGQNIDTPFVITPSLFRLEPGQANQVRILLKEASLPVDRETVFFFRAVALPVSVPKADQTSTQLGGELQLASGNVIKLFYRPQGLAMTSEQAQSQLRFTAAGYGIKVTNPTPYHLTFSSLSLDGKAVNIRATPGNNMLPPFSERIFPHSSTQGDIQWQLINDYGGIDSGHGKIK